MASIGAELQQILGFAPQYTSHPSPAMRARDAACLDLRHRLQKILAQDVDLAHLHVAVGGHQGSYGPVPWVRIFSQEQSPNATAGIYLAYLFAADGSRVYLSLQQGSSELRSGRMRPVSDPSQLRANGAVARAGIRELIESPLGTGLTVDIDLAGSRAPVTAYSRQRIGNYEHANILALPYASNDLQQGHLLLADLRRMLALLLALYGEALPPTHPIQPAPANAPDPTGINSGRVQGLLQDSAVRRAVEIYAEDHAVTHFTGLGWDVRRVGPLKLGYDLQCENALGQALHVEVKGTQSAGEEVSLTRNEVLHVGMEHACPSQHALYVVSDITVTTAKGITCSGGKSLCLMRWAIEKSLLTPTTYAYRVPDQS